MIRGLLVVGFVLGSGVLGEEPAFVNYAPNRFEYEHNVLEKLVYLEQFKTDATERIAAQAKQIHTVLEKLLDLEQFKEDASEKISVLEKQLQGPPTRSPLTNSTQSPLTPHSSSTYVHWGMKKCPNVTATTMVYSGQAAGGVHGSGEYICLPNDPEYDKYNQVRDDHRSLMYGAEYQTHATITNSPALGDLHDYDVPCSFCLARGKTTLMIPGRTSCYSGWTKEYKGYLMGAFHSYQGKGYVCVDKNAEALNGTHADLNGALLYLVEGRCGTLQCPQYLDGAELACVVCSTTI